MSSRLLRGGGLPGWARLGRGTHPTTASGSRRGRQLVLIDRLVFLLLVYCGRCQWAIQLRCVMLVSSAQRAAGRRGARIEPAVRARSSLNPDPGGQSTPRHPKGRPSWAIKSSLGRSDRLQQFSIIPPILSAPSLPPSTLSNKTFSSHHSRPTPQRRSPDTLAPTFTSPSHPRPLRALAQRASLLSPASRDRTPSHAS